MPLWEPQAGPQAAASICPASIIFFGGTRGGGKTDCGLGRQLHGAEVYGKHWNGIMLRRKYKDFAELRRRIDNLITDGLPAERIGGDQQVNFIRFRNGASITLLSVIRLEQIDSLQGQQYTEITVDEAPAFPFIFQMLDKLKGCNRSPHGVPCSMFLTGNPGGPGSSAIKTMFIDKDPLGLGKVFRNPAGESQVFIKSTLADNRILCENDPLYVNRLQSISDEALRKAWLDGDWNVYVGQAFRFTDRHIIDPIPIPEFSILYMTYDWGHAAPFSIGWWFVDSDNRVYRFAEWYGCEPDKPNTGIRMPDTKIIERVIEIEHKLGITNRAIIRLADPTCQNKKPTPSGQGSGPSTAEMWSNYGLTLLPGDADRKAKIRQFRERLIIPDDDTLPMMVVFSTCKAFIRIIPTLCLDDYLIEDVDTDGEDHIYDESCHIAMARPVGVDQKDVDQVIKERERQATYSQLPLNAKVAWDEIKNQNEQLDEEYKMEQEILIESFREMEEFLQWK